eukprot:4340993-Lingulodinium_polyedra.AAC.1
MAFSQARKPIYLPPASRKPKHTTPAARIHPRTAAFPQRCALQWVQQSSEYRTPTTSPRTAVHQCVPPPPALRASWGGVQLQPAP